MTFPKLPPYRILSEPALSFDHSNSAAVLTHPLRGLIKFGPYSKKAHTVLGSSIRVATIGPPGSFARIAQLFHELNQPQKAQERRDYLPDYPGSEKTIGLQIAPAPTQLRVELPATLKDFSPTGFAGPAIAEAILADSEGFRTPVPIDSVQRFRSCRTPRRWLARTLT